MDEQDTTDQVPPVRVVSSRSEVVERVHLALALEYHGEGGGASQTPEARWMEPDWNGEPPVPPARATVSASPPQITVSVPSVPLPVARSWSRGMGDRGQRSRSRSSRRVRRTAAKAGLDPPQPGDEDPPGHQGQRPAGDDLGQLILVPVERVRVGALSLALAARGGDRTAAIVFEARYGVARDVWEMVA